MCEYVFSSPEITKLAKALITVQKNLQPAIKDSTNPFVKNRYASLNSVMDTCRDALIQNGILLTQYPVPSEQGTLGLVTKLIHVESGQFQASLAVAPLPKADPQGYGSCITYLRRYALSSMLGIVTEDDDANKASYPTKTKTPAHKERKPLSTMLAELNLSDMTDHYRRLLQTTYNCRPDKLSDQQYQEQVDILASCRENPLAMCDLMKKLNACRAA